MSSASRQAHDNCSLPNSKGLDTLVFLLLSCKCIFRFSSSTQHRFLRFLSLGAGLFVYTTHYSLLVPLLHCLEGTSLTSLNYIKSPLTLLLPLPSIPTTDLSLGTLRYTYRHVFSNRAGRTGCGLYVPSVSCSRPYDHEDSNALQNQWVSSRQLPALCRWEPVSL